MNTNTDSNHRHAHAVRDGEAGGRPTDVRTARLAGPAPAARGVQSTRWAGYAACVWALAFAAVTFYWAAGGTVGSDTIGPAITNMAHDPVFIVAMWGIGVLTVLGGLLGLALVRRWGRAVPRRVLLTAAWGGGILMALYGGASWVQESLMVTV